MKLQKITKESTVIEALQACRDLWIMTAQSETPNKKPRGVSKLYRLGCPACAYHELHSPETDCLVTCVMKNAWPGGCLLGGGGSLFVRWASVGWFENNRRIRTAAWRIAHAAQDEIWRLRGREICANH